MERSRTGSSRAAPVRGAGETLGDDVVTLSRARKRPVDGPDRGTGPLDRIGAAPRASRAEADRPRKESYRLEAGFYVRRTRVDGSEMSPFVRRTRPPGRGGVRTGSRRRRPRIVCRRMGTAT
jgi:hypothetical protein